MPTPFISRTPIDEIQCCQTFDLRPWHDAGDQALHRTHLRQTPQRLHASVHARLDRPDLSGFHSSPNNLIKHHPAFVGRVRELTELRKALKENGWTGKQENPRNAPCASV